MDPSEICLTHQCMVGVRRSPFGKISDEEFCLTQCCGVGVRLSLPGSIAGVSFGKSRKDRVSY
jgi:hypothetical protein